MTETAVEPLRLADWRRRVMELYAEVRRLAAVDPPAAHDRWRSVRETLYREHPASPVRPEKRAEFRAIHFPYDAALRFEVRLTQESASARGSTGDAALSQAAGRGFSSAAGASGASGASGGPIGLALPISTGQPLRFERIGWLDLPFQGAPRRLALFWLPEYSGGLFLPFRDATNGQGTYGGGRYLLDSGKGADLGGNPDAGTVVVDFNFAYQPSCAFDPQWSCPLAPPENRLDIEVRAGERII
jgi:uncharacterized protein (DUF1684 family)